MCNVWIWTGCNLVKSKRLGCEIKYSYTENGEYSSQFEIVFYPKVLLLFSQWWLSYVTSLSRICTVTSQNSGTAVHTIDAVLHIWGNISYVLDGYCVHYFQLRPSSSMNGIFCPSVRLSHLFDYVPINVSSWNFQELLPMTIVRSMQKSSQRSQPNLTVSGL